MRKPTLQEIKVILKEKGYVYYNGPKPFDVNIIGIRTADRESNTFNDWMTISGRNDKGHEFLNFYPCTTDPGLYWLKNPMQVDGTAIMVPGQYKGAYKIGLHKGYVALEQKSVMCYVRDNDKDAVNDIDTLILDKDNFIYDNIKSNIHRANERVASVQVDKWSAACQVLADPDQFDEFIELCKKGEANYSNSFTYTLLEEKDFKAI